MAVLSAWEHLVQENNTGASFLTPAPQNQDQLIVAPHKPAADSTAVSMGTFAVQLHPTARAVGAPMLTQSTLARDIQVQACA